MDSGAPRKKFSLTFTINPVNLSVADAREAAIYRIMGDVPAKPGRSTKDHVVTCGDRWTKATNTVTLLSLQSFRCHPEGAAESQVFTERVRVIFLHGTPARASPGWNGKLLPVASQSLLKAIPRYPVGT
jgi:hypothetical protein